MESEIEIKKTIDLENVIKAKNPNLLRVLPGFLIRYLKRVIHQDEVNAAISRNVDKYGLDFVYAILEEFKVNVKVINEENIPDEGRYIIAANHPLGGLDGMALISLVGRKRKDIIFPVNDILMNLKNLAPLFIPINKHGRNTENIALFEKTFASDNMILYFPAGLCSRKQKHGKILDLEWKKTFISRAKQYKRDVLPVHINGKNSNFFYNLSYLRKLFGVKANIEMLYLVDEMYKQRGKDIIITFGKPISFETFDKRINDNKWASKLKDYVYSLGMGNKENFKF
ncbi:MAG: 1-acyl-sn-glycerol-3-phosphate acyltransferase [Bacteroidetes bacterium]|nr:1-acyl-sn-glycerol-3-phosphate acyltransferase [Bacteroidota bacterium]